MQLDAPIPLTPAHSTRAWAGRRAIRIGETVWCMRPRTGRRSKAGSPLRSAPALHRVKLYRSGLAVTMQLDAPFPLTPSFVKALRRAGRPSPLGRAPSSDSGWRNRLVYATADG